jgi:superfamily II DNA or RNA helicase
MHQRDVLPLPGDLVWIRRRRWRVERARRDRHVVRLDVAARDRRLTFLSPFDRVFTRASAPPPRSVRPQQAIARLAHLIALSDDVRLPSAAISARAEILPHQLEPAMAVLAGQSRILIADEVGLGKTVQAGLVIAELLRRDPVRRMLVIAPASLRDQWMEELAHRFDISCVVAHRTGLDARSQAGAVGDNPWRQPGVWIASADFLKQRHVADALPRDPWDLVVIDEAHAMCGDSDRYDLCHQIACRARRTMLLTATPHSGDETRFTRLIELGRLSGHGDRLTVFRRTRASLGHRPARRVRWHRLELAGAETSVLDALRAFERVVTARSRQADQALLLLSVFRKRALSTMSALSQSLTRRLAWLGEFGAEAALEWAQPRLEFEEDSDDVARDEREGLTVHSGLGLPQERSWLRRLRVLADEGAREERKVRRLVELVRRTTEPVVVFTEFRDSLDAVLRQLRFARPVSVLHGSQDAALRRHQLQLFLEGSTSVLLATDVAGQGLNLQSRARWVISLELPWNPARLEQRIGRVDRISQTRSTHLTLLVARDEAESGLLLHLARRVLMARRGFGDDALASVTPPEQEVRAALLRQEALPDQPRTTPVAVCRHWERSAIRAARALRRRRALAAHWKAPGANATSPVRAHGGPAQRLMPSAAGSLLVFSVPILNADDVLLERRLVAIAIAARASTTPQCRALDVIARPAAFRALSRRVAAVARIARTTTDAARGRERALALAVHGELALDEAQPGLFDLREARAFDARVSDSERLIAAADLQLERENRQCQIRAGEPVLEIVLSRRDD